MNDTQVKLIAVEPIVKTVNVKLSPPRAFRLFTEDIARWWPLPSHSVFGEDAVRCHMETGVGGRLFERHRDGRETDWGVVRAWDPPTRVAFTLHPGRPAEEATDVEVTFMPFEEGTRVTLMHTGWERQGALGVVSRERYIGGWVTVLERFVTFTSDALARGCYFADPDYERSLYFEAFVPAALEAVWDAWTTQDGALSFFAPVCNVDPWPDGRYEMLFNLDAPVGEQGGEGLRILALQPRTMLSFSWNAPPHLDVRNQRTHVTVRFQSIDAGNTKVSLRHDGWGDGGDWDAAFSYFASAWGEVILPRLRYRFAVGPVDWANRPDLSAFQI